VARAVDVRVVALLSLIFDVGHRDGDAALALLGRIVNGLEGSDLRQTLLVQHHGDRRGQRGLAMIHVTDGSDVDVGLFALILRFRHVRFLPFYGD